MEKQDSREFLMAKKKVADLEAKLVAHDLESKKKLNELEQKLEAQKKVCKVHELERKELEEQLEELEAKLEVAKKEVKKYLLQDEYFGTIEEQKISITIPVLNSKNKTKKYQF